MCRVLTGKILSRPAIRKGSTPQFRWRNRRVKRLADRPRTVRPQNLGTGQSRLRRLVRLCEVLDDNRSQGVQTYRDHADCDIVRKIVATSGNDKSTHYVGAKIAEADPR